MIKQVRPKLSLLLLTYHRIYINAAVGERSQTAAQTAPLPGHPLRGLAPLGGYAQTAAVI